MACFESLPFLRFSDLLLPKLISEKFRVSLGGKDND